MMWKLGYTSCNEDAKSEIQSLKITPDDRVLCITGSGARALDLLTCSPKTILSIDCNPLQNYLLELKVAGIKSFSHEELLSFLGIHEYPNRLELYNRIKSHLSESARNYWDSQLSMIQLGVVYQGGWEKHFSLLSKFLHCVKPRFIKELFTCNTLEEQHQIWMKMSNGLFWKIFLKVSTSKSVMKYVLRDNGFYRYVPNSFSVFQYLKESLDNASNQFLFRDSHFCRLLFLGKWDSTSLPLHLQHSHFENLKKNIGKISWKTCYLNQIHEGKFDKFSLSDFSSYIGDAEYFNTWKSISHIASENAVVCERQFLVKRNLPIEFQFMFNSDLEQGKSLKLSDESVFYTFNVCQCIGK